MRKMAESIANTNIAIVKYWGKHPNWKEYNVPTKSSLAFVVDKLLTKAEVKASPGKGEVKRLIINKKNYDKKRKELVRVQNFIEKLGNFVSRDFFKYNYEISSESNFPIASGLASSASAFAALSKALLRELSKEHSWTEEILKDEKKLSAIARLGSGSASRSISKGVVLWKRGWDKNEFNPLWGSYSEKIAKAPKDVVLFYIFVTKNPKKVPSEEGMKRSLKTSPFYWEWVEMEEREIKEDIKLIKRREWEELFPRIIKHSNSFHAICRATYPPIEYLNEKSIKIIEIVHKLIEEHGNLVAYTFDAGPNPVVFSVEDFEKEVKKALKGFNYLTTKPL